MTRLISLKDRIRFALLPKRWYLGYQARRYARRTEPELDLLRHLVAPDRNALDIGANKGVYSWHLARLCRQVFAFEPNPVMFDYLQRAVPANVHCYPVAIADYCGDAQFKLPVSEGKFHYTRGSLLDVSGATGCASFSCKVATIDSYGFDNVGFMKIDIEGAELDAIRGATETIRESRPVILAEATGVGGSSATALLEVLQSMDYLPLVYTDKRLRYIRDMDAEAISRNCFFLPME